LIEVDKSFTIINERKKLHLSIVLVDEKLPLNYWSSKTVALLDLYQDDFYTQDLVDFFGLKSRLNKSMFLEYIYVLKFLGE
jgi:hypothetical protein